MQTIQKRIPREREMEYILEVIEGKRRNKKIVNSGRRCQISNVNTEGVRGDHRFEELP